MPQLRLKTIWGEARALLHYPRKVSADLVLLAGLAGLAFALIALARESTRPHRAAIEINLSPWALPQYTLFSLLRGLLAYLLSLGFTFVYGYWAAKDRLAERVLIPLLDILQSIPVLGFMPGLVIALIRAFPASNIGLELAAVLMIFTGQVWNMTFSFFHSLRSIPLDQREVATIYHFGWWQRFQWVELPFSMIGLIWNSMMSMAGGWFFLIVSESFRLGDQDYRLAGIGSYMSEAIEQGNTAAMLCATVAMILMIVALDQLLWRPVVVWGQKFRVEEGGQAEAMSSWFLNWLRRSRVFFAVGRLGRLLRRELGRRTSRGYRTDHLAARKWAQGVSVMVFALLVAALTYGAWRLLGLLRGVSLLEWTNVGTAAIWTLIRVLSATLLGTLWALPAGLAIGLRPALSRVLQPVVQVVASFPAPMLFPLVIASLKWLGVSLGWGSILLMLLGTQWYILFNVIAGAMAIPADLQEAARSYHVTGGQRFWSLYFPSVFPYLLTGWVTAAGGAWNASIVAEYVTFKGETLRAVGLGAEISEAAQAANFPLLTASVLGMSAVVVVFNQAVWRRCYQLAERRFSLSK